MQNFTKFIFELAQLRYIKRAGWTLLGIREPNNIAEHSLRAAQIGYILAKLENYPDPNEVCSMLVFHDISECRVGDLHKVGNRYVTRDEERAVHDQLGNLGEIGESIHQLWERTEKRDTQAGIIAKDADYLEAAFEAKEYLEKGYSFAQDWINNVAGALKTENAKKLCHELSQINSNAWWQGLKKIS